MVKYGPHRRVEYRRKREGRTDYRYRVKLLRSDNPRLVTRISLNHVRAQVAIPEETGDRVLVSAFSKELSDFGWKGHTSNTPAAYLVGLLCGYRAQDSEIEECVLDIDKYVPTRQAKIFAVLKGILDVGVYVPHNENVLPSEDRCTGEVISEYARGLNSDEEKYKAQFSSCLERDLSPEDLSDHFKQVKEAIEEQYGGQNG